VPHDDGMHGVERETGGAWLSVGWENGTPDPDDRSFERGAAFAAVLARTLRAAGYEPKRLQISLGRGPQGVLELHVVGDVPGMPQADFESLARVTLHAVALRRELAGDEDLVLLSRLDERDGRDLRDPRPVAAQASPAPSTPPAPSAPPVAPQLRPRPAAAPTLPSASPDVAGRLKYRTVSALPGWASNLPLGRIAVGLVAGLMLGVLGLPRLDIEWPWLASSQPQTSDVSAVSQGAASGRAVELRPTSPPLPTPVPTLEDVPPTVVPTIVPTLPPVLSVASAAPGVLFAERFVSPLVSWPNDPRSTAWFEDGAYQLYARDPGRFVTVGVPLAQDVGDGAISAQFHKVGGPAGGGYGFVIRNQGKTADLDGKSQNGSYLVVEVGDRGEVGIWQRDGARWIDVLTWRHADAVRTGEDPNLLVLYFKGQALRLEVNGEQVADLAFDGLPARGGVGVFVGGDLNEAALEWLRVESA
jgi:hypothetical protein